MSSIENHLTALKAKHTDLEGRISDLEQHPSVEQAEITRLKKEKLQLKEEISKIESDIVS